MDYEDRRTVSYKRRSRSRSRSRERRSNEGHRRHRRSMSSSRSFSPPQNQGFLPAVGADVNSIGLPMQPPTFPVHLFGQPGLPTNPIYASMIQQGAVPGMMTTVADKTELELFVGNTPPGTSEFVLLNFLNVAMSQVNLNIAPGPPILQCRVSNKYAFIELRSREETNNALSLNGIPFMGIPLKVGRPSKYRGPSVESTSWQALTGQPNLMSIGVGNSGLDPATKVYRELYVGNTNNEMTEASMAEFLGTTLQKVGLATPPPGNPVVAARSNGNFFFIELRSIEDANAMLNLNGIPFLGQNLKVSRPSKYPGPVTPSLSWPDVVARLMAQGDGALAGGIGGSVVASSGTSPPSIHAATRVLRLNNMLSADDLADEEGLADIEEETKSECASFGTVNAVHIVRPSTTEAGAAKTSTGVGFVFVEFDESLAARKAMLSLSTRTFDGKKVEVTFWDEAKFRSGDYGDSS